MIHNDNAPTHLWRIGRVIELIKSKSDIEVSGASVKVPMTSRTLQRFTSKLIPVDCIESHLQNNDPHRLRSLPALLQRSRTMHKKRSFQLRISSVNLVTFTEDILN